MVIYDPKSWWKLIFQFHKSDTFRMLSPTMLAIGIYVAIWVFIENTLLGAHFKSTTVVHSLLGFVLSLLLVFRTNTAYDRWWEGRRQWGAMINNARNLAAKLQAFLPATHKSARESLRILITNYALAAKEHLRKGVLLDELEPHPRLGRTELNNYSHIPNRIAVELYAEVEALRRQGVFTTEQLLLINEELRSFSDILGACERIKSTPIPYSYSLFIKKIIFIYTLSMPIGFVQDFGFWTIPIVIFTFYAFASLELIAEEIEDPFGKDANDLPTDEIAGKIKSNLKEMLK